MGDRALYEYALYKGDTFLDVGTMAEIAERQGIPLATLRSYGVDRRNSGTGNGLIIIKIGKVGDE